MYLKDKNTPGDAMLNHSWPVELSNTSISDVMKAHTLLITDQVLSYFLLINMWGPGQCITILGLVVNSLNIITFVKQGVRDAVNVSLLALTVSDLGSLVFLFFFNLCWTPPIIKLDLPFYPQQIMYFLFWGHLIFTRVTTGTTAWIAFERCLCIVIPLRIKSIITPKRTVIYICILYILVMATVAPMMYTSRFTWIFDPARNKSKLGFVKISNRSKLESIVFVTNNILPIFFFIFILVCTVILVKTLQRNSKWRQQTSTAIKTKYTSNKDNKVVKMVLIISIAFIFCYAPGAVFLMLPFIDPEMRIDKVQKNFVIAVFGTLVHLEGINATINFFIYIKMSSKFKATFRDLFCVHTEKMDEAKHGA